MKITTVIYRQLKEDMRSTFETFYMGQMGRGFNDAFRAKVQEMYRLSLVGLRCENELHDERLHKPLTTIIINRESEVTSPSNQGEI